MSENRSYPAFVTVEGKVIATHLIEAPNRGRAVNKMLQWFWGEYKNRLGLAADLVTVGDPYYEVVFEELFNCNDKRNNYLDEQTLRRVVEESKGVLIPDTRSHVHHNPRRSLKRSKRRREYRITVLPNIHQSNTGIFYYRVTVTPQKSKGGTVKTKRKHRDIRLEAKTLPEVVEEIKTRRLRSENKTTSKIKRRSLKLLAHLSGMQKLNLDDQSYFSSILEGSKKQ